MYLRNGNLNQSWIFKCVAVVVAVAVAVAVAVVVVVAVVVAVAVAVAVVVATVLLIKHGFLNDFTAMQCRLFYKYGNLKSFMAHPKN